MSEKYEMAFCSDCHKLTLVLIYDNTIKCLSCGHVADLSKTKNISAIKAKKLSKK